MNRNLSPKQSILMLLVSVSGSSPKAATGVVAQTGADQTKAQYEAGRLMPCQNEPEALLTAKNAAPEI